jgi:hypothetical protein
MSIGKNWSLHYREIYEPQIKRLTDRYNKIYDENKNMKKRLEKYEGKKVNYYNRKDEE